MRFGVLGPLEVIDDDGNPVDVGGRQPRLVLAALIAAGGRVVGTDALVDLIWRDRPPASAAGTLQSYVSRLRRVLEPVGGAQLVYEHGGYRLELPADLVDADHFDSLAAAGRDDLAAGRPFDAQRHLAAALALWRGPALVELTDLGEARHQAAALEERRLAAVEARLDADLALGQHQVIVGELQVLVAEHPVREGFHARLALALYRSGRQAEALNALAEAAAVLREEHGLDPGAMLADLERGILDHDPGLAAPPVVSAPTQPASGGVFVGRADEAKVLLAAYEAARRDAQFVVVEGDPGIGKTRLVEELASRFASHGSSVVWARSDEIGATRALWPWVDVVRELLAQVDESPPALDDLLVARPAPGNAPSASDQLERFGALALLLERFGSRAPIVVVLDDLHWFDPASLELFGFLATRLRQGVLVIATLRTLEIGRVDALTDALSAVARRPGTRRIRLTGLSRAAAAELLDASSTGPTDPARAARIHELAEGNPFYTLELARLLDEPGRGSSDVPATVADAVRRRLQELDPATRNVLTVAAVTGRDVDVPLVAAVAGLDIDACAEQLDHAAAHRMLVAAPDAPGKLRFAHALVREVLLDGLTPLRRARLHLQVADALEATGTSDVEISADHLWRAAPLGVGDRAAAALEQAAERAVARSAYSTAEELLGRAAGLRRASRSAASPAGRLALLDAQLRLIAVMQTRRYFSGTDRALLRSAQALAAELGRDDTSRELAWSEWASASRAAHVAGAQASAERYRRRWAASRRPTVRAGALIVDGVTAWSTGEIAGAIVHLDEAAMLLTDEAVTDGFDRQLRLVGDVFALYCHAASGDATPGETLSGFDRILAELPELAVDGRHQIAYALACRVAAVHTQWDTLGRLVGRASELETAGQLAFFDGQVRLYQALLEARDGRYELALATFADGRARFRAVGGRTGIAACQALLAEHMARAGRLTDAATLADAARDEVTVTGELADDVTVRIAEACVVAVRGDSAAASELFATAIRTAQRRGAHAIADRAAAVAGEFGLLASG